MRTPGRRAEGDGREWKQVLGVLQRTPAEDVTVEVHRPHEIAHVQHKMTELTDLHGLPLFQAIDRPSNMVGPCLSPASQGEKGELATGFSVTPPMGNN